MKRMDGRLFGGITYKALPALEEVCITSRERPMLQVCVPEDSAGSFSCDVRCYDRSVTLNRGDVSSKEERK